MPPKPFPSARRALALLLLSVAAAPAEDHRGPFTAPPRSVRSRDFDQQHIRLELALDFDRRQLRGTAIHTLSPFRPLSQLDFDAAGMEITDVRLRQDGAAGRLDFRTRDNKLSVELDRTYQPGEVVRLAVAYTVTEPTRGAHFVQPRDHQSDRAPMLWTQSEPEYARYWFPCLDYPADRLTSEILVTVPQDYQVLSNGQLQQKTDLDDGTRRWHWVQAQSHVTYLLSVAAGQFDLFEQSWDGIPVLSYVPRGRAADAPRSFAKTPEMVRFFSERFGYRYPWPKYAQICVEEYGWGGMEHTSATTLNVTTLHDEQAHLDVSSDGLVAHELVHQWYGDLITCKDWAEIWLNESFATYFTTVWMEKDLGPDEATWRRYQEAESYFHEDRDRYRRPIVSYRYHSPDRVFDRHAYPKGGRVLHMLRFVLGDDLFWKAIRHYTKKHAFQVVETAQFRIAVEEATGQGLNWFFRQWLHRAGHPEYDVRYDWDEKEKTVRLTVRQTQKVDELTPLFRMPLEIELVTADGSQIRRITVSRQEETFHFALDQRPRRIGFDPHDWVLKSVVFHKSREEWLDQLAGDEHLICRLRAVQALAESTRDEAVRAALARALGEDAFWGIRQEAAKALGRFRGDPARQALIQAATGDAHSQVRREAIQALKGFPGDPTRQALRQVIRKDPSYYAVAEALRTLVAVDRDGCRDELRAALDRTSHQEVILRAACDGLAELGDRDSRPRLRALLAESNAPFRRVAALKAIARLAGDDPETFDALAAQLDDPWYQVRQAACGALAATGNPAAVPLLQTRRTRETTIRMLQAIDDALEKLRTQESELANIRRRVEELERQNRKLEQRLQTLESPP